MRIALLALVGAISISSLANAATWRENKATLDAMKPNAAPVVAVEKTSPAVQTVVTTKNTCQMVCCSDVSTMDAGKTCTSGEKGRMIMK